MFHSIATASVPPPVGALSASAAPGTTTERRTGAPRSRCDEPHAMGPPPWLPVRPTPDRAVVLRASAAIVAIAAVSLLFIASYAGALHEPTPHDVPVAVAAQVPAQLSGRLDASPGRRHTLWRIGALAGLALLVGFAGAAPVAAIGGFGGSVALLGLVGTLTVAAVGAVTVALQSVLGVIGTGRRSSSSSCSATRRRAARSRWSSCPSRGARSAR